MKTVVVEGVGDAAHNLYAPALRELKTRLSELRVIFTDDTNLWSSSPGLLEKRTRTIESLKTWGAEFFDKSSRSKDGEKYRALRKANVDVVFIATNDAIKWTALSRQYLWII